MKRKIGMILIGFLLLTCSSSLVFASNGHKEGNDLMTMSTSEAGLTTTSVKGLGLTIRKSFPDANLAQAVADRLAAGDINHILTQNMIWSAGGLDARMRNIQDLTGFEILTNLSSLFIESNQLEYLPDSIGNLVNLETLNIDDNQLKSLPDSIGNLVNLKTLKIEYNQLTSLPTG